jgi:lysylphosphatidylglycerol synthetase-like protein (DUF2156 family)
MSAQVVERDERTVSVENASYRLAYLVLSFGVLLSVMYRSFRYNESAWELMALVVLTGGLATAYQASQHVLSRPWSRTSLMTTILAIVVAIVVVLLR